MRNGPSLKTIASIECLVALLEKVIRSPQDYVDDTSLRTALGSQGALAAFERSSESIFASSLNTQKRICEAQDSSLGGYKRLDELRTDAQKAIQEKCRILPPKPRTRDGLKIEIKELKASLNDCRGDCLHLTGLITAVMRAARLIARDSGQAALVARWAKTNAEIYKMVSETRAERGQNLEDLE